MQRTIPTPATTATPATATSAPSTTPGPTAHPRATLAATILGSSLAFVDGSVVNVALPALARDLRVDPAALSWAINAYLLPVGALILLGGALGDHFGRRRLFLIGLVLFTGASALCAGAPSLDWLLAARGLQGCGAALLMPNSLAILGTAFVGEARGRAIGTWAAAGALAGALGPVLGGWLVDTAGWRVIFLLNLPIAGGAAWLAARYVTERIETRNPLPLDGLGAGLATLSLGILTGALTKASAAGGAPIASWLVGFLLLAAFVAHERRRGSTALMPLALFASRGFVGLNLLTFFLYGGLGGLMVLLPFLLIDAEHWTAVRAGAALLPIPVLIGGGSRLMGRFAARRGPRMPLVLGSCLVGAGLAAYTGVTGGEVHYWTDIFPPTVLVALGMGACVAPLTTAVMASVDPRHVGIASGFNSAVARIAGLIATALLGFVFVRHDSVADFVHGFHVAVVIGAIAAFAAAGCTLAFVERGV